VVCNGYPTRHEVGGDEAPAEADGYRVLISDSVALSLRACGQGCVGSKATFARLERRVEERDCVHGGEVGVVGWESGCDRGTCVIWRRRIGWLGSVSDSFLCRDVSSSASCSAEGD